MRATTNATVGMNTTGNGGIAGMGENGVYHPAFDAYDGDDGDLETGGANDVFATDFFNKNNDAGTAAAAQAAAAAGNPPAPTPNTEYKNLVSFYLKKQGEMFQQKKLEEAQIINGNPTSLPPISTGEDRI